MSTPLPLPAGTAIPSATAALMNILAETFAADSQVQVLFGPQPQYVAPVIIQVSEATGDQTPAELAPNLKREETFSLVCSIITWSGDSDYQQRMADAFAYFTKITPVIGNNATLTDPATGQPTVRYAQVGNFAGVPSLNAKGQSQYQLDFHIRCEQRIRSLDAT